MTFRNPFQERSYRDALGVSKISRWIPEQDDRMVTAGRGIKIPTSDVMAPEKFKLSS
jgi:hypothetical protein